MSEKERRVHERRTCFSFSRDHERTGNVAERFLRRRGDGDRRRAVLRGESHLLSAERMGGAQVGMGPVSVMFARVRVRSQAHPALSLRESPPQRVHCNAVGE